MSVNDPTGYRGQAAADLITHFSGQDNVSFAFVSFDTAATQATTEFTNDPVMLSAALNQLNTINGFTNYLDALGAAQAMVDTDIANVATELAALPPDDPNRRFVRPWYFVVFLSDGIPRMPGGILQPTDQILFRVRELVDVPPEAAGLTLYTAFLGASDDALRPAAEDLLQQMAAEGGGTYASFESGEDIDFSIFDFQVKRRYDIKQFYVYNRNVLLTELGPRADSDMDGIADYREQQLGTDPARSDSNNDGCSDGFALAAGMDPLRDHCPCTGANGVDTDHDGLTDCEELFLGYDAKRFDSDRDLFPDWLELRYGTNAADPADVQEDLDFDGVITSDEIREGMSPIHSDSDQRARYGFVYSMVRGVTEIGSAQTCYRFEVQNVSLAETTAVADHPANTNDLVVETVESPEDDPEKTFALRRAVIPVQFASGRKRAQQVQASDFNTIRIDQVGATGE